MFLVGDFGTFWTHSCTAFLRFAEQRHFSQGCDCAANWLILANSDPNFVISEISVNQVRKCFPAWGLGVFTIQEQLCKCHHCRTFLCILANFPLTQSHPCSLLWILHLEKTSVTLSRLSMKSRIYLFCANELIPFADTLICARHVGHSMADRLRVLESMSR